MKDLTIGTECKGIQTLTLQMRVSKVYQVGGEGRREMYRYNPLIVGSVQCRREIIPKPIVGGLNTWLNNDF